MNNLEKFQVSVGVIVSMSTGLLGWFTYKINVAANENNVELKRIEQTLSESKFGFERIRDVYDRTEKYLSSENQNPKTGRALVVLISSLPKSELQSNLLSLMVIESEADVVAAEAADAKLLLEDEQNEIGNEPEPNDNSFFGDPQFAFSNDGFGVVVIDGFGYRDSDGVNWEVPAGFVSDGASIPRSMWSTFGLPLGGKYRIAAILHDYYTIERSRSSEDVNNMFYNAMLSSGVSETKAKLLYAAIQSFGPKWDIN